MKHYNGQSDYFIAINHAHILTFSFNSYAASTLEMASASQKRGWGTIAQSVERANLSKEVPGSTPAVAAC